MSIKARLLTLLVVLLFGTMLCASDVDRLKGLRPQIAPVSCRFKVSCPERDRPIAATNFAIRGTARHPEYLVDFDHADGSAFLERHEDVWPETFDLKVLGWRDTILFLSLIPDGYGEMLLLFHPGKKFVDYYDKQGRWLSEDHPKDWTFCIETEETGYGVDVKVTLAPAARLARRLEIKWWSTSW